MRRTGIVVLGFVAATIAAPTSAASAVPEAPCTCRFKGQDMQIGQIICANLPNGDVLMMCDRVLNNTSWKTLQQGCPVTSAIPMTTKING